MAISTPLGGRDCGVTIGNPHTSSAAKSHVFEHFGPYFLLADVSIGVFSVFDDLKYDRSDADIISPPMRRHAIEKLKPFGFKQKSGSILHNQRDGVSCYIPKPQVLGASPFDIARYEERGPEDYFIMTPTQTACQFINKYALEVALERMVSLVQFQPININRIFDYMDRRGTHKEIASRLHEVAAVQREAIKSEPLCRRRALR
ncbi:MAG: hypothetical protein AAF360_06315 [Pseudomonadota bacterium]